jgi:hypothetical protein
MATFEVGQIVIAQPYGCDAPILGSVLKVDWKGRPNLDPEWKDGTLIVQTGPREKRELNPAWCKKVTANKIQHLFFKIEKPPAKAPEPEPVKLADAPEYQCKADEVPPDGQVEPAAQQ